MLQINNLSARIAAHRAQIEASINRVVSSGWLILGAEVNNFEHLFASYLGADHCIGVANGTDAIELALKAVEINTGDKVATVANAGMYSTMAILAIGAEPCFMDVDLESSVVTLPEVMRVVENGAKAVIVTHLYGLAVPDIEKIAQYCKDNSVALLEDCAQAHGAKIKEKCVGTFGDVSSFSFYPTKNLGALGDGGAVVTNSYEVAERIRSLRQYGWSNKYTVDMLGGRNSRLDEMQAAILSGFLGSLDATNKMRREVAARYSAEIKHPYIILPRVGEEDYVAHLYVVRSEHRDSLREHLHKNNIASDIHYPIPDYQQSVFGNRFSSTCLENTERLSKEVLTLPCYPEMTNEVDLVIDTVNGWKI